MNLLRLFHTVKYLKPVQIYGRLWFKLYRPGPDLSLPPETRPIKGKWVNPCKKPSSLVSPFTFKFLNAIHELKSSDDWNNPGWEKLWLYNLHYFDDLQSRDAETKKKLHLDLIERWIRENPSGSGNGWEPFPTSLRIVNWIKWSLDGNCLSEGALHSLAVQARCLSKKPEYHLLGNHLFANAKALIFAGLFFCGREADRLLSKGLQILEKQMPEQILADGGHFELSPMYHAVILEDLLDLINIMTACGMEKGRVGGGYRIPGIWLDSVRRMLHWLEKMCHPDGKISFFNDAALGIAPELTDLKAYAGRLGFPDTDFPQKGICELSHSGYVRLENSKAVLIADVGRIGPDYLPGHAHADTLSFELSLQGQRVFVNSGISCYGNSSERLMQRGTACHNTLTVDGKNSSQVWSGFRVAKRAYPVGLDVGVKPDGGFGIKCGHNGFKKIHWREWLLTDECLDVTDHITGTLSKVRIFYHLYPGARVDLPKKRICLNDICIRFQTDAEIMLKDTSYYPEFGRSVPNTCLVLQPVKDRCHIKFIYKE